MRADVPSEKYLALTLTFVIAYAVTFIVANTYNMVVDSILICCLVDEVRCCIPSATTVVTLTSATTAYCNAQSVTV